MVWGATANPVAVLTLENKFKAVPKKQHNLIANNGCCQFPH
jgi:hypothetical protein